MAIRYDQKLNNEIRRIVKNYNAKIRRLNKREDLTLPPLFDRQALKSMKQSTKSRADLRRKLKNLQEFSKRGGEQNIMVKGREIPRYQYKNIQRYRNLINRRLNQRQKFNETTKPTYEGNEEQFTIAQQFNEEQRNIQALRSKLIDVDYLSYNEGELASYFEKLESNAQTVSAVTWQNNYLDMLLDVGYTYNIPHAKLHDLREKLKSLSPAQFDRLVKTESTIKQIIYHYKLINELGVDVAFESMQGDVESLFESLFENIDFILKDYQ